MLFVLPPHYCFLCIPCGSTTDRLVTQINLGIGTLEPAIVTALTPDLRNTTGNGTLCIPKLTIPAGLAKEGDNATLQVVTFDSMGAALYNVSPSRPHLHRHEEVVRDSKLSPHSARISHSPPRLSTPRTVSPMASRLLLSLVSQRRARIARIRQVRRLRRRSRLVLLLVLLLVRLEVRVRACWLRRWLLG